MLNEYYELFEMLSAIVFVFLLVLTFYIVTLIVINIYKIKYERDNYLKKLKEND